MFSLRPFVLSFILCLSSFSSVSATETGLVGHWLFDEGSGEVLHDRSGHGIDGVVVGAQWVSTRQGQGLHFSGMGSYVDFGDHKILKSCGDTTILAWLELDASPFPDETTNWTLLDCEVYRQEGFVIRIDGASNRVMYRASCEGFDRFGSSLTPLKNKMVYFLAVVRQGDTARIYLNGVFDGQFALPSWDQGETPFRISAPGQSFSGVLYELAIADHALDNNEILDWYWRGVPRFQKNFVDKDHLKLIPHIYNKEKEACVQVGFQGVMPLAPEEQVLVELSRSHRSQTPPAQVVIESRKVTSIPERGYGFYAFNLTDLQPGQYELSARLVGGARVSQTSVAFEYPASVTAVPSPEKIQVDPLPPEPVPPSMGVRVQLGGGLLLTAGEESFPIESTFSFPGQTVNTLTCSDSVDRNGESAWEVKVEADGLSARGRYYSISRHVSCEKDRLLVSDTITNTTDSPQGILIQNRLNVAGLESKRFFVGGREAGRPIPPRPLKTCPILFAGSTGFGIGMAALDDVYIVQARGGFDAQDWLDLFTNEFALDSGASYTLEWAIYSNATGDYYDLVNALRRDEHRNDVTLEGGLAFLQGTQQKRDVSLVPPAEFFDIRNAHYATVFCLSWCADDPGISVEGIDFVEHPIEKQRIAAMMKQLARVKPEVKGMFHVAHQLYATNQPEACFPDSRVVNPEGKQVVYSINYADGGYFSRERYEQNWRWWIYYPTLENSFGKAMLDSVDVMMDELGCRGVFSDGFLWGYGGDYTYDRWDGHSADIDPASQTILRKKGSVLLLSQDAMIAWCRKIWNKDGVVIANGVVPTRTICSLPLITDKEVTEGPDVPLLPTPVTLSDPAICVDEVSLYQDVLNKLRWGNLYFYYNEPRELSYESLPKQMYPITVQEIHAGTVKGKERIITLHSGVYGWRGSQDLVTAYRYDSRGHRIDANYLTTVDAQSVRTKVTLGENESAVLVRIPVSITTSQPVNVMVDRLDDQYLLRLNGKGEVSVSAGNETYGIILDGTSEWMSPKIAMGTESR